MDQYEALNLIDSYSIDLKYLDKEFQCPIDLKGIAGGEVLRFN